MLEGSRNCHQDLTGATDTLTVLKETRLFRHMIGPLDQPVPLCLDWQVVECWCCWPGIRRQTRHASCCPNPAGRCCPVREREGARTEHRTVKESVLCMCYM